MEGEKSLEDVGKDMLMNVAITTLTHGMSHGIDPTKLGAARLIAHDEQDRAGSDRC